MRISTRAAVSWLTALRLTLMMDMPLTRSVCFLVPAASVPSAKVTRMASASSTASSVVRIRYSVEVWAIRAPAKYPVFSTGLLNQSVSWRTECTVTTPLSASAAISFKGTWMRL